MKHMALILVLQGLSFSAVAAPEHHHNHEGMGEGDPHAQHGKPAATGDYTPVPEPTDAERAAAFPDLSGHGLHHAMDIPVNIHALLDRFEWVDADAGSTLAWEGRGWLGNDKQRVWLRTEGERRESETASAELQLLYGRPFARWWDWVAGARHDFEPGPSQNWLAAGVQGLAPYWFETAATLFLAEGGQTQLRVEFEYELLLTQKLVLQPRLEVNVNGQDDERRDVGSGLSTAEAGLRLRYEIRREIAPYIGINWERALGDTGDLARAQGEARQDTAVVAGLRLWY